jgi:hypothetical protein
MGIDVRWGDDPIFNALAAYLSQPPQQPPAPQQDALSQFGMPGLDLSQLFKMAPGAPTAPGAQGRATAVSGSRGGGSYGGGTTSRTDPNKAYYDLLGEQVKANAMLQRTQAEQAGVKDRALSEISLRADADVYEFWRTQQVPEDVLASLNAGRASYTPKQKDERNRITNSIAEAMQDPNLTEQQRLRFLGEQYKKLYQLDSNPTPLPPDQWKVTPQQEYEQGTVTMPDPATGLMLPYRRVVRNGESKFEITEAGQAQLNVWEEQQKIAMTPPDPPEENLSIWEGRESGYRADRAKAEKVVSDIQFDRVDKAEKALQDAHDKLQEASDNMAKPPEEGSDEDPTKVHQEYAKAVENWNRAHQKAEAARKERDAAQAEVDRLRQMEEEARAKSDEIMQRQATPRASLQQLPPEAIAPWEQAGQPSQPLPPPGQPPMPPQQQPPMPPQAPPPDQQNNNPAIPSIPSPDALRQMILQGQLQEGDWIQPPTGPPRQLTAADISGARG